VADKRSKKDPPEPVSRAFGVAPLPPGGWEEKVRGLRSVTCPHCGEVGYLIQPSDMPSYAAVVEMINTRRLTSVPGICTTCRKITILAIDGKEVKGVPVLPADENKVLNARAQEHVRNLRLHIFLKMGPPETSED